MKNIMVAFLFCLTSTIANAQTGTEFLSIPKIVTCGPLPKIFKWLSDAEVNEKPIWVGKSQDQKSNYALFVNTKTTTFTLVEFEKDVGCILGVGIKSQQSFGDSAKTL